MSDRHSNVPTTHQRSLREAARRFLRDDVLRLCVPAQLHPQAAQLVLKISDIQPGRLSEPRVESDEEWTRICMYTPESKIVQLSGTRPEYSVCWVPGGSVTLWTEFVRYLVALAEAGYPGCVGCGGADAEIPWDESERRSEMLAK